MTTFDITITEKGGVGKSVVTALRAQHYLQRGSTMIGLDTDPSNPGFSSFGGLPVEIVPICEPGSNKIVPRMFDELITLTESTDADYVVIDTGTSNVLALLDYFSVNDTLGLLGEMGHRVRFHAVIRGASDLKETLVQFANLCQQFPSPEKVVWLNQQFGPIKHEGKSFEELQAYKTYADQVHAIIKIPHLDPSTFGEDMTRLLMRRETFAEALAKENTAWSIVQRHRLGRMWKDLDEQMTTANL